MIVALSTVAQACAELVGGLQHADPRNTVITNRHFWSPRWYLGSGGPSNYARPQRQSARKR